MKRIKHCAKIVLLSLLPTAGFAVSGIYIDAQTGWSDLLNMPSPGEVGAVSVKKQHVPSYRVSIGYLHDFNRYIGVGFEVGT